MMFVTPSLAQNKNAKGKAKTKTTKTVTVKRQHLPASERRSKAPDMTIRRKKHDGKYLFETLDGKEVCPAEFDDVYTSSDTRGLYEVKLDGKWYLIDSEGKSLLKEGMDYISCNDFFVVVRDFSDRYSIYDLDGKLLGGKSFSRVDMGSHSEDVGAINVTYNNRTTAIDLEGNVLPGLFQKEDCDIDPAVKSSIDTPWFYSEKYGILNAEGEVIVNEDIANAFPEDLGDHSIVFDNKFYTKNKLTEIFDSYKEFSSIKILSKKYNGSIQIYDMLGNIIVRYTKAKSVREALKKGKNQIIAYLSNYPEYRKQIYAKYYEPYIRLTEKKANMPAYTDFCEGPSVFDMAKEKQKARLAAEEKARREQLAREEAEKKARAAEERKRKQEQAAAAKKAATSSTTSNRTTASANTNRSNGYSPNAENKAYGNHTDINKTNPHYSVPAYGTLPLGDYYYLCNDGYATHIEITSYQGNIEATSYDGHFISADKFAYGGIRGDWLYFYGINILSHKKWGAMEMYIAKDWSKVVLTTEFGNIFDQQCSEYTATLSFKAKNVMGWGYSNTVNLNLQKASEARTNMILQDIQNTINSSGSSHSSGTSSTPSRSSIPGIRVKEYGPDYTGQGEKVWCEECHGYDFRHYHYYKR